MRERNPEIGLRTVYAGVLAGMIISILFATFNLVILLFTHVSPMARLDELLDTSISERIKFRILVPIHQIAGVFILPIAVITVILIGCIMLRKKNFYFNISLFLYAGCVILTFICLIIYLQSSRQGFLSYFTEQDRSEIAVAVIQILSAIGELTATICLIIAVTAVFQEDGSYLYTAVPHIRKTYLIIFASIGAFLRICAEIISLSSFGTGYFILTLLSSLAYAAAYGQLIVHMDKVKNAQTAYQQNAD